MNKNRLEAFSDGVLAVIITIMVLELKAPHSATWQSLLEILPQLISYILSFIFIGIYWGNHHHLLHPTKSINGSIIWANMHLLFWLSLIPFATNWMGENHFSTNTVIVYAILLFLCGIAFYILQICILKSNHFDEPMQLAIQKSGKKAIISLVAYFTAIPVAVFLSPKLSCLIFIAVSIVWLVPEKEIENALSKSNKE